MATEKRRLYRLYGDRGLLYIGVSANIQSRIREHKRSSPWYPSVKCVLIDAPLSAAAAYRAEAIAIKDELPLYNLAPFHTMSLKRELEYYYYPYSGAEQRKYLRARLITIIAGRLTTLRAREAGVHKGWIFTPSTSGRFLLTEVTISRDGAVKKSTACPRSIDDISIP